MQTVKETVQAICNILQAYGLEPIDANIFRQAKHNLSEAIKPASNILHNVLILDLFDFQYKLSEIEIHNKDSDGLEIILLALRNSPFIVYKNGKPGMDYSSSRDILLIIGQILAEADIFEKYRKIIEKKVNGIQLKMHQSTYHSDIEIQTLKFESEGSQVKDLENLHRIIKHQFKQIHQLLKRKDHQTRQIEKVIAQMNLKDINLNTILSLSDPDQLNEILMNLKEIISYLEIETQFHRHQEIFWAWLESIVEEDKKDVRDHVDYGFPDESIIFLPGQQMIELIQTTQLKMEKLRDTFDLFESISIQFEDAWEKSSAILQEDPGSEQKLQQLQLQVHKIVAQNTIRLVSFKTFKEQIFNEKDLLYCNANDFLKYTIKKQIQQSNQLGDTNGFEFKISNEQENLNQKIDQLHSNLEVDIRRIKNNLSELQFYPEK